MMIQLRLLKRQDAISMIMQLFRPKYDTVQIKTVLSGDEMDTFVFALGEKRTMAKLSNEMSDLSLYCSERKNGEKFGLPPNFTVFSELPEVSFSLIDSRISMLIAKYHDCVDYVHVSDHKAIASEQSISDLKPLLLLVFYVVEKVRRFRLTRDESFLKTTHAQRQEAAQIRREERARERKEKLLAEEDPERQRKLEKLELKREMKKKQPRMKQLKIKAS
ncbi:unnamed protein product [Soboliphyme baturini]|uniref:PAT complex subunit CCDC47 n=1 Tax=Soboliphyme baturini TaxID=241478 RepID=A0A183IB99_9BILA|nr:unnamed protein product [Soboliphyme baturini]